MEKYRDREADLRIKALDRVPTNLIRPIHQHCERHVRGRHNTGESFGIEPPAFQSGNEPPIR